MFIMVIKLSLVQHIYDSKIFEECLNYNLNNKDIEKIIIISDFHINFKHNKIVFKVDKNVDKINVLSYVNKLFLNKNIIISHPYIKIKDDLSKLDKSVKYVNDYLTIYPKIEKSSVNYYFNIDILIENIFNVRKIKFLEKKKDSLITIIVSYNYLDILEKTLPANKDYLDDIYIITDETDINTINYCNNINIKCLTFNILENGILNKSKAINLAILQIKPISYILLLDSDIILSKSISLKKLKKDVLYSCTRIIYPTYLDYQNNKNSIILSEPNGLGFFQLFHKSRFKQYPNFKSGRYSDSNWADKVFSSYFKTIQILDKVSHIGTINNKWFSNNEIEIRKINTFVGIAAIPTRENSLKIVIESLIDQVDQIGVYLNGWGDYIPEYLKNNKILVIKSEDNGDFGDAGKFYWVDSFEGYYFSCDDDIIYPSDYIERTIKKISFYNKKAVIGFHGSVILPEYTSYYDAKSRWVLSFKHKRGKDEYVHILGTGTVGFHTSTMKVKFSDFKTPNIADMYFALLGQEQKVPFIVQEHELDEMKPILVEESLSMSGMYNIDNKLNTTEIQNELIKSRLWNINNIECISRKFKILMIGRFDIYKKGGIYKSNNSMKYIFEKLGHQVISIDSMQENFKVPSNIDLCIIYPGDLSRPDFIEAEKKMMHVLNKGIPCCINMSYLNDDNKTIKSVEQFRKYINSKNKIYFLTFTEDVKMDSLLYDIKDLIIPFPKTININIPENLPTFEQREGIIIGDVAKLQNNSIINGNAQEWIDAIKVRLPDVKIYAYKQYGTKTELKNLELIPYTTEGFSDLISKVKVSVCINQKATFEMLPVESQLVGTPVVYRDMPQSLNQWIGFSGICVNNPIEFSEFLYWLYTDQDVWNKYSKLSVLNAEKNKIENLEIAFQTSLNKIMINSRN